MNLVEGTTDGKPWQKLVPNQENVLRFLRSREEPKLLFTAPAGVYLLSKKFEDMNLVQRLLYRLIKILPINLGKGVSL